MAATHNRAEHSQRFFAGNADREPMIRDEFERLLAAFRDGHQPVNILANIGWSEHSGDEFSKPSRGMSIVVGVDQDRERDLGMAQQGFGNTPGAAAPGKKHDVYPSALAGGIARGTKCRACQRPPSSRWHRRTIIRCSHPMRWRAIMPGSEALSRNKPEGPARTSYHVGSILAAHASISLTSPGGGSVSPRYFFPPP